MSHPEPAIRVNVDVTNPGQFFACCGLPPLPSAEPLAVEAPRPRRPWERGTDGSCGGSAPTLPRSGVCSGLAVPFLDSPYHDRWCR